ncbi:MAG: MiaB/RimO family radical SAM methylthiotransferase, partial [Caldimicrobium sp.]
NLLPEVDEFYGIEPFRYFSKREPAKKICTESSFYAYIKISEGCSHRCSYCTIPKIRGPFRSKPKALLLKEVQNLLKEGVKEIILVGQDITSYGKDLGERKGLVALLKEISKFSEEFRIRLLYLHPAHISEELIEDLLSIPKVIPYFDLPIQHAHPDILRKMRRNYSPEKILRLIECIRRIIPFASIRTSIITGFPGEGDREFEALLDFLREAQFDYLGVFPFYPEEGTPAEKFSEKVSYKEKQRRVREILKLQREITKERLKARVGQEEEVLILGEDLKGRPFGLAKIQAPEIDGITYVKVNKKKTVSPGELFKVKIIKSGLYDLWVEPFDLSG